MKRSNKLLIGLLIVIFVTPLGLLMAFREMVKEDNYTAIRDTNSRYIQSGKIGHYSVVSITGPDLNDGSNRRILTCHLHSAEEGYFECMRLDNANILRVRNERDTLFIDYVTKSSSNSPHSYFAYCNLDLHLRDMENIVVNRAILKMDSIDIRVNPAIGVHLNDATLKVGDQNNEKDEGGASIADPGKSDVYQQSGSSVLRYGSLSVSAEASDIDFGRLVHIDTLTLNVAKESRLSIGNGFQVNQLAGAISDQTTVISNMRTVRSLRELNIDKQ